MFGHDDKSNQNDAVVEPKEDTAAATDTDTSSSAAPAEPAITALPPTPAPSGTSVSPSFIPTDDKGQPDASAGSLAAGSSELLDIKQQALQQLSPLVGHLNQTPEEKFRTTMMMIQAADDQTLIPEAYAAAKEITDEKTRAQALLDIVNEINYFTQQHDN